MISPLPLPRRSVEVDVQDVVERAAERHDVVDAAYAQQPSWRPAQAVRVPIQPLLQLGEIATLAQRLLGLVRREPGIRQQALLPR